MKKEEEKSRLISAEPERGEYAPVLRVMIAVCYMGILAGVVAAMAALLSIVSRGEGYDKLMLSCAAAVLFLAAVIVMSVIDKRREREYERERCELFDNAQRYDGVITGCEKHTRVIVYANSKYEEVTWCFTVTYKDEKDGTVTVRSGMYLNDISEILSDKAVSVVKLENGEHVIEDIKTAAEGGIKLEVKEVEDE